ncbi:hypothetical protein TRFO_13712 [Tritrichomonas foetus]|uniref:Uncharacterized protein n=1 Tax=Tritrichomonas foetus TaxID=1144522 RepID=A0A1J4L1N1_9EUKA|nr:hypothetical protein TRFO_13712 [Tritrichomonas foetus]|eukprot:OHT15876.1 hypothetical protein TRFO_13712 [Tritrichomonas foetus]
MNLNEYFLEVVSLADKMRNSQQGTFEGDLLEVVELVSEILKSFIVETTGCDPLDNITEYSSVIDDKSSILENKLLNKFNDNLSIMAKRISKMQIQLLNIREDYQDKIDILKKEIAARGKITQQENQEHINMIQKQLDLEMEELKEKEKMIHNDIVKYVSIQNKEISDKYNPKLQNYDKLIHEIQIQIHEIIHKKHLLKEEHNDCLLNINKKLALENEATTIKMNDKIDQLTNQISSLKQNIEETKILIKQESDLINKKNLDYEEHMIQKINDMKTKYNEKRVKVDSEIKNLEQTVKNKMFELEKIKTQNDKEYWEIGMKYTEEIKSRQNDTKKAIQELNNEITKQYTPILKEITTSIDNIYITKEKELSVLSKKENHLIVESESELSSLNHANKREIDMIERKLEMSKNRLHQLQIMRDSDIESRKKVNQISVGKELQRNDDKERDRSAKIAEMMRLFDEQQYRLINLQRTSLEQRNQQKAELIRKMKIEHEKRINEIINYYDEQYQKDSEDKYHELETIENESHINNMNDINNKIKEIHARTALLEMKMEGLMKATQDKYQSMIYDSDPNLLRDIKRAAADGVHDESFDDNNELSKKTTLSSRIIGEANSVEKRKEAIDKEADELHDSIAKMKNDFEKKITNLRHQYAATKHHLITQSSTLDNRCQKLQHQVKNQKKQIEELDQVASSRREEIDHFEANFNNSLDKYKKCITKQWEAELESRKSDGIKDEILQLKNKANDEMNDLKNKLNDAKDKTKTISQYMLLLRNQKLEETQESLKIEWNEKKNILEKTHEESLSDIEKERNNVPSKHHETINTINQEFDNIQETFNNEFIKEMEELSNQMEKAEIDNKNLSEELEYYEKMECDTCALYKLRIRQMLEKRDEMEKRALKLKYDMKKSENQMNNLFSLNNYCKPAIVPVLNIKPASNHLSALEKKKHNQIPSYELKSANCPAHVIEKKSGSLSSRIAKPRANTAMGIKMFV